MPAQDYTRTLAFDPGHTTGCALAVGDYVPWVMLLDFTAVSNQTMESIAKLARPNAVLIESLPTKQVDRKTLDVYQYLKRWFVVAGYPVFTFLPSRYKKQVTRSTWSSRHARDAADLARWVNMYPEVLNEPLTLGEVML